MPRIDKADLAKELSRGQIRPIYIIVGSESYLSLEALGDIKAAVKAAGSDALSSESFTGREVRAEALLGALRTVPMLGGRPLVVIREGESLSRENQELLAGYMEGPVESSTLVVVADKLDGRGRFMQLAAKNGAVVECKPLYLDKVPSWINAESKKRGRQMSQKAAQTMAAMVGNDLGQITQAIERVILYIGDRKLIEEVDVLRATADTHQHTIFELCDAVGSKSWKRSFSLLNNVLENGESPVKLLVMLSRHFRILSKAKEADGKMDARSVASYIGVNPYFARNYLEQSKRFSAGELKAAFRVLHRCDRELKSSPVPKERVLERALFELIRQKGAPPSRGGAANADSAKNAMPRRERSW